MIRRPPISPRMDTLLPYTPLFRSGVDRDGRALLRVAHQSGGAERRIGRGEDAHHAVAGGLHRAAARDARLGVELGQDLRGQPVRRLRSEEHTSELQSLMRISYAVFCLKKKKHTVINTQTHIS